MAGKKSMHDRGVYLTPPGPTCSVRARDRGLSKDFAGVGATLQLRRGLCQVPCISALARRMGVPAVRRTGGLVGSASSLALRQVPIRDVGHRRHHLPGQPSATDDLVPGQWYVTSQKNGISALGLQRVLGLGSYKTAWAMLHKLR